VSVFAHSIVQSMGLCLCGCRHGYGCGCMHLFVYELQKMGIGAWV